MNNPKANPKHIWVYLLYPVYLIVILEIAMRLVGFMLTLSNRLEVMREVNHQADVTILAIGE